MDLDFCLKLFFKIVCELGILIKSNAFLYFISKIDKAILNTDYRIKIFYQYIGQDLCENEALKKCRRMKLM